MPFLLRIRCFIVTQNIDNLTFSFNFLAPFQRFIVLLPLTIIHKWRNARTANNPLAVFLYPDGKYSGIVPPWKSVMEIQPLVVIVNGKGNAVFLLPETFINDYQ